MKSYAIILAGGSSTRFGGKVKKQFTTLCGKELWQFLLDTVTSVVPRSQVVVVGVDIPGGSTRNESVKIGLEWVADRGDCKRVIIFEAARPLVTKEQIETIESSTEPSSCFYVPVVDTVIINDSQYFDRSRCKHIVSPQAFDFQLLYEAYKKCVSLEEIRTDETRLMFETYGILPELLRGGDNLFKVTYPKDLAIVGTILSEMQEMKDSCSLP